MPGPYIAVTERLTHVNGFVAGCGQAALLVILHVAKGLPTTPAEVRALIVQGQQGHQAGLGGTSTPANLIWLAQQYNEPLQSISWGEVNHYLSLGQPVIVGVSHASAFGGSDRTVNGHYVTIVGKSGRNYVVSDPNTPESETGQFVLYSPEQFAAAGPFWSATANVRTVAQGTPDSFQLGLPDLSGVNNFFTSLGGLANFLGNPVRVMKILIGALLIFLSIILGLVKSSDENGQIIQLLRLLSKA